MQRVKSLRGAPLHVKQWWSRTGVEWALFRMVSEGATWDDAHERLVALYQRWWDRGRRGRSPLSRLHNRAVRLHVLEGVSAGHPHVEDGRGRVALTYPGTKWGSSSFVRL